MINKTKRKNFLIPKTTEIEKVEKERLALLNILEDVEEARKRAEEEKNKTLAIITNFADGLLVFGTEGNLSLVNTQAEIFLDIKPEEKKTIIGKPLSVLIQYPNFQPLIQLIGNQPPIAREIKRIFRKELSLKKNLTLEVSVIPMAREKEGPDTLVILHDVTREKTIEQMKTEFVSLVAHQLRTPLSAIKWTLKMLLDGDLGEVTAEQREFIEKTYISNERMISLINDLLDVTRIEEGKYLYKPILADMGEIIQSVLNTYKEEIKRRKIKFKFEKLAKKPPRVKMDVEKMTLVIQNLLENAIRYVLPRGEVTISLGHDTKEIEFKIQDTGVGIPKDQQERVFTQFFRGTNVIKLETEGSGLGLYIAKNIIEAHGGKIWFESEENRGTTFHFTIPVQKEFAEFLKEF